MKTQIKIRWTNQERNAVINRAVEVMNVDNVSHTEALNRAQQQVLPISRRRNFVNASYCHDLIKLLKQKLKVFVVPMSTFEMLPEPAQPKEAVIKSEDKDLNDVVDSFVQEIAKKLATAIKKEMVNAVVELEHSFKIAKANIEQRQEKPKFVVIGLREDQETMIENEYKWADFKFMTTDEAKVIASYGKDSNAVLLMKNFICHAVYDKYKHFSNHVLIDGGMTTIRAWLSVEGSKFKQEKVA